MAKRIRVLIYEGPEEWIKKTLDSSGVPANGVRIAGQGKTIRSTMLVLSDPIEELSVEYVINTNDEFLDKLTTLAEQVERETRSGDLPATGMWPSSKL